MPYGHKADARKDQRLYRRFGDLIKHLNARAVYCLSAREVFARAGISSSQDFKRLSGLDWRTELRFSCSGAPRICISGSLESNLVAIVLLLCHRSLKGRRHSGYFNFNRRAFARYGWSCCVGRVKRRQCLGCGGRSGEGQQSPSGATSPMPLAHCVAPGPRLLRPWKSGVRLSRAGRQTGDATVGEPADADGQV